VANDATSTLSARTQAVQAEPGLDVARAPGVRDTVSGTRITAEIPAVPAGPSYGVLLPDGTVWYPGSKKKLPAPPLLRVLVWIVAFAALLIGIVDLIIRYEPGWTNTFRHVVATSGIANPPGGSTAAGGQKPPTSGTTAGQQSDAIVQVMSPQPSGLPAHTTAYSVKLPSYSVKVSSTAVAFVQGTWLSNGNVVNVQDYTLAASGPTSSYSFNVPKGEEFKIQVAHVGVTVQIYYGLHLEGTAGSATEGAYYLVFVPQTSSTTTQST
jgi:hypothetical protein